MKKPNLTRLLNHYKGLFKLGDMQVLAMYSGIKGLGAIGLCLPPHAPGPKRCIVVVDGDVMPKDILPVLLHELIHVEQIALHGAASHNDYFKGRVRALMDAGFRVMDHRGNINAA